MSDDQSDQPRDDKQEEIEELLEQFKSSDDSPADEASNPTPSAPVESRLTDSTSGDEQVPEDRQTPLESETLPRGSCSLQRRCRAHRMHMSKC